MSSERCGSISIRSASRSTSTIRRTTRSASCSSLRRAPAARSRSVTDSPTRPSAHSATSISSSRTLGSRGGACSNVGSRSVRSGTRRPLEPGTEVSHPGSTPRAETMPASPTSLIRMATAGCYRNRSEEHTSELQSLTNLVCRLLLEKKKKNKRRTRTQNKNKLNNKPHPRQPPSQKTHTEPDTMSLQIQIYHSTHRHRDKQYHHRLLT